MIATAAYWAGMLALRWTYDLLKWGIRLLKWAATHGHQPAGSVAVHPSVQDPIAFGEQLAHQVLAEDAAQADLFAEVESILQRAMPDGDAS